MGTEILSEDYDAVKDAHSAATTGKLFYVRNGMVMMAMNDADAAADNIFVTKTDNLRVPKAAGTAWSIGQQVFYDAGNSNFTVTWAAGLVPAGYVRVDAASADTEGQIVFNQPVGGGDPRSPAYATYSVGAEAADAITVSIQLKNALGDDLANRAAVHAYLSADANGDSLVAASATLSAAAGTDGVLVENSTDNGYLLISEADGDIDVTITETSGAATYYLVLVMPDGRIVPSAAITFAA